MLVLVATDVNRSTRLGKSLDKLAVTVECEGFSTDGFNGAQTALRDAMQFAADRVKTAGKRIDAPGLTALVERAGPDIMRLRKDIDTLVLFVGEAAAITAQDVRLWSAPRSSSTIGPSPTPSRPETRRRRCGMCS